jgi:hypothetical protein
VPLRRWKVIPFERLDTQNIVRVRMVGPDFQRGFGFPNHVRTASLLLRLDCALEMVLSRRFHDR